MGIVSYIKEEIRVVRERDPAIKSNMEVLLYPSFRVILRYRVAHKLYFKKTLFFGRDGFHKERREKQGLRFIRELKSDAACLLITGVELSSVRQR
mgnify:CR=1 FL=1